MLSLRGLESFITHPLIRWKFPFTNNVHEQAALSAGRSQSRTTQNEQATQHRRWLLPSPRRSCTNHRSVRDVLAWCTSGLEYALFVKGIFSLIIHNFFSCKSLFSKRKLLNFIWFFRIGVSSNMSLQCTPMFLPCLLYLRTYCAQMACAFQLCLTKNMKFFLHLSWSGI